MSGGSVASVPLRGKNPSGGVRRRRFRSTSLKRSVNGRLNEVDVYCIRGVGRAYPQFHVPAAATLLPRRRLQRRRASATTRKTNAPVTVMTGRRTPSTFVPSSRIPSARTAGRSVLTRKGDPKPPATQAAANAVKLPVMAHPGSWTEFVRAVRGSPRKARPNALEKQAEANPPTSASPPIAAHAAGSESLCKAPR